MSVPSQINDGDWKVAKQDGPVVVSYPFLDRGDGTSFELKVKRKQDYAAYKRVRMMQTIPNKFGTAYLVECTDATHFGNGIYEWEETYACVPVTRIESSSIVYAGQFVYFSPFTPGSIQSVTNVSFVTSCKIKYEYSLTPLPAISAPRVIEIDIGDGNTIFYLIGGWRAFPAGTEILAQDTSSDIYKCQIYVRQSITIIVPATIGSST